MRKSYGFKDFVSQVKKACRAKVLDEAQVKDAVNKHFKNNRDREEAILAIFGKQGLTAGFKAVSGLLKLNYYNSVEGVYADPDHLYITDTKCIYRSRNDGMAAGRYNTAGTLLVDPRENILKKCREFFNAPILAEAVIQGCDFVYAIKCLSVILKGESASRRNLILDVVQGRLSLAAVASEADYGVHEELADLPGMDGQAVIPMAAVKHIKAADTVRIGFCQLVNGIAVRLDTAEVEAILMPKVLESYEVKQYEEASGRAWHKIESAEQVKAEAEIIDANRILAAAADQADKSAEPETAPVKEPEAAVPEPEPAPQEAEPQVEAGEEAPPAPDIKAIGRRFKQLQAEPEPVVHTVKPKLRYPIKEHRMDLGPAWRVIGNMYVNRQGVVLR